MSSRFYRFDPELGRCVEIGSLDELAQRNHGNLASEGEQYGGLAAPDGSMIDSRKKRREWMKAAGMTDPSDYRGAAQSTNTPIWDKQAKARADHFSGKVDVSGGKRREQLSRLANQFSRGARRK